MHAQDIPASQHTLTQGKIYAKGKKGDGRNILFPATLLTHLLLFIVYPIAAVYLIYFTFAVAHSTVSLQSIVFVVICCSFMASAIVYVRNTLYSAFSMKTVGKFTMSLADVTECATQLHASIPRIAIFVPARNEGPVIENTVRRLAKMDYLKSCYHIFIITDERERDDNVQVLTRTIVERVAEEINGQYDTNLVQCVEVPRWYSGVFGSQQRSYEKSTKGRALNYALQSVAASPLWQDIDFIGVVDADGRLHVDVLKEVAYKALRFDAKLLQGPVFQVSNLGDVSIVGEVAALELALHHLTDLSSRLMRNRFHFLAGTNYFIEKSALIECGAWNQYALVEDAELAMRLYIYHRVTATWLDCYEIEQTPPSFRVYCRQRERWVRGYFALLPYAARSALPLHERARLLSKILLSQFRFVIDASFPIIAIMYDVFGLIPRLNLLLSAVLVGFLVLSFLIWDIYGATYRRLTPYLPASRQGKVITQSIKLFSFVPIMIGVQVVPRMTALSKTIFAGKQGGWYKTERTKEAISE